MDKSKKAYLKWGGVHCPKCDSSDLATSDKYFLLDGGKLQISVRCCNCGFKWDDIYKLINTKTND
jgi:Zn ribbon nucleic-acid-binding protein